MGDVALLQLFLLPVLSMLLSGRVREKVRSRGELHSPLSARLGEDAKQVHLRALEGPDSCPEAGQVRHWSGLPCAHCGSRRGVKGEHGENGRSLQEGQGGHAPENEKAESKVKPQ